MYLSEHERLLPLLLAPQRRPRYHALLEQGDTPARDKFLFALAHSLDLDPRFATKVPPRGHDAERAWIEERLRAAGAPRQCYVIASDATLDGRDLSLDEALDALHGQSNPGVISCIPGQLAYYEAENSGERFILDRTGTGT